MKKLEIVNGGHRLRADDLIHLQEGLSEAIKGVVSSFATGDHVILSGATYTDNGNGTGTLAAGFIMMDGEIFQVDERTYNPGLITILGPLRWVVVTTVETSRSPVTYKDNVSHNVHVIRKATLEEDTSQAGVLQTDFAQILEADITPETDMVFSGKIRNEFGRIKLTGKVTNNTGSTNSGVKKIGEIPVAWAPSQDRAFRTQTHDLTINGGELIINVKANGDLEVAANLANQVDIYLDLIEWSI